MIFIPGEWPQQFCHPEGQQKAFHVQSAVCMLAVLNCNYDLKLMPVEATLWEFEASAHKVPRDKVLSKLSIGQCSQATASSSNWKPIFIRSGTDKFICSKNSNRAKLYLIYIFATLLPLGVSIAITFFFLLCTLEGYRLWICTGAMEARLDWQLHLG